MEVFPIDFVAGDVETSNDSYFRICIFGKTVDGRTACVRVKFFPHFFLEIPESWNESRTRLFMAENMQEHGMVRNSCTIVKKKCAWGFDNGKVRNMIQCAFPTMRAMRFAKKKLEYRFQIYESSVDPIVKLFHLQNIKPAQWIDVTSFARQVERESRCDVEVTTMFYNLHPGKTTSIPPIVIASWDIETYSKEKKFPLAENRDDHMIQIATSFVRYGDDEPYRRVVVCFKSTANVEGVEIVSCSEEHEVTNEWIKLVEEEKTDVLIGYNIFQYDWKYVHGRAQLCVDDFTGNDLVDLSKLGRLLEGGGDVVERDLSSNAFGQNKFFYLKTPGIMQLDLLQWFRKNRNLESYSLNNVSKLYLGDQKLDLPAYEIFAKFEGDANDRAVIAEYAAKDTLLPIDLLRKMAIFEDFTEMANAVRVPVEYINFRGQGVRCFSCVVGKAREMGFAIPDGKKWATEGKYDGATVLSAKKGAYFVPIAALDFASLYPSIMRAHNMSPETLVMDARSENIPGVEYYEIETGLGKFKYAQKKEDGTGLGIIPALLDDLAKFRKLAKKDMAKAKHDGDDFKEALYDAKQKAFKVVMNSVYGFLGASVGFLPCVPIAASVTATGRKMIEHTAKRVVELLPGSEVIYGDSVASYTPVTVRIDGLVNIVKIEDLCSEWKTMECGKEYCDTPGLETWTDDGWTPLVRVIRHKINKPMVRVVTRTGIVDVTDEHSLLDDQKRVVVPRESDVGDMLLHANLPTENISKEILNNCGSDALSYAKLYFLACASKQTIAFEFEGHEITTDSSASNAITAIQSVPPTEYVYDMTTENHHFSAGIGRLIVHNTDSVMIRMNLPEEHVHDMDEQFKKATWLSSEITKDFKAPNELEMEKIYSPYVLYSKKRYAALKFEDPNEKGKVDVKGIALVRRDFCPITREILKNSLDTILFKRNTPDAVEYTRECIRKVLDNEYPMEKFAMSKTLRTGYKNTCQPHLIVANKVFQRTGFPVPSGSRVPFVYVTNKDDADVKQSMKAEDFTYAKDNNLIVDRLYYLNHQLLKPICSLFDPLVDNPEKEIFGHELIKTKIDTLVDRTKSELKVSKRLKKNKTAGQPEITSFFKVIVKT